jgi:hypothetical protein
MGECGIGSRVQIPEGDVLPAKLAISVTTSPKYVHTLLEWLFSIQKIRERQTNNRMSAFSDVFILPQIFRNGKSAHDD